MLLTPVLIALASWSYPRLVALFSGKTLAQIQLEPGSTHHHSEDSKRVILAGYGRTGQNIAQGLQDADIPYFVIDIDPERIHEARGSGKPRMYGDASNPHVLEHADLQHARMLVVTFPDPAAVVSTVREALHINPNLKVVARVHRIQEAELLKEMGVTELINPEFEASMQFLKRVLETTGKKEAELKEIISEGEAKGEYDEFEPEERYA
jgi:CPA2 family monovalent cation:H+ antiporter-2